jgi:hypothetical protein
MLVVHRFVWSGIQKSNHTWARAFQACQRSKISHHTVTLVGDFTLPATRFLHVHIDLVGPLPISAGYTYCFTAVDRFTRWQKPSPSRHHSWHRGTRPIDHLDIPFQLPADHHHRPGTSVWVTILPLSCEIVWNWTFPDNRPPSRSQRSTQTNNEQKRFPWLSSSSSHYLKQICERQ